MVLAVCKTSCILSLPAWEFLFFILLNFSVFSYFLWVAFVIINFKSYIKEIHIYNSLQVIEFLRKTDFLFLGKIWKI